MKVKALMPVRIMNLVVPLAHKATDFTTHCAFGYNPRHVQKKHIGSAIPLEFAAKSRNRTVCGFFVSTSYGGADGRAQALPVSLREFPGIAHLSALPPIVQFGRQSFNGTLEANMANSITPFNFGSHAVRIVLRDATPWFVAADVCRALGYKNTSKAITDHLDEDEQSNESLDSGGKAAVIINESGLYALVLRSHKPEARKFAKWVTSEVLPAIRKTGGYSAAPAAEPLPSLQMRRWLISYDHTGAEQVQSVPIDAAIISPSRGDDVHAYLGEMLPTDLIPEALATLTGRIARALHVPAASKSTSIKKLG